MQTKEAKNDRILFASMMHGTMFSLLFLYRSPFDFVLNEKL